MFGGFNPTGAIGTGVSSGAVPAVANPLDSAPAGGGKGGGKGGGFAPPPPQNMYGGVGYNSYMGAGGIRPTSVPTQFSGFNAPTPMPTGGMIPLPETNFSLPFTPSPPSAGKVAAKVVERLPQPLLVASKVVVRVVVCQVVRLPRQRYLTWPRFFGIWATTDTPRARRRR